MENLLKIMADLRNPEGGCPWDIEQTFKSIAPHTVEEAYEVVDAIERSDMNGLKEELGDLLLQVVFHSQIASEHGIFNFQDVVTAICDKLVSRHPHVFADAKIDSATAQEAAWEEMKAAERGEEKGKTSLMDNITVGLPAMLRAIKLQKRAAKAGFDWKQAADVIAKIEEELLEIKEAIDSGDKEHQHEEFGDLLFACANLARKLGIDPEEAIRAGNRKFEKRFRAMENMAPNFNELDLDEQEKLWQAAKKSTANAI